MCCPNSPVQVHDIVIRRSPQECCVHQASEGPPFFRRLPGPKKTTTKRRESEGPFFFGRPSGKKKQKHKNTRNRFFPRRGPQLRPASMASSSCEISPLTSSRFGASIDPFSPAATGNPRQPGGGALVFLSGVGSPPPRPFLFSSCFSSFFGGKGDPRVES